MLGVASDKQPSVSYLFPEIDTFNIYGKNRTRQLEVDTEKVFVVSLNFFFFHKYPQFWFKSNIFLLYSAELKHSCLRQITQF